MADKEYIERGALIAMCKRQIECEWNTIAAPGSWADAFEDFSDLVEQTPAADLVEVVRCKDCKHFVSEVCRHDFAMNLSRGDDFCSCGERKEQT